MIVTITVTAATLTVQFLLLLLLLLQPRLFESSKYWARSSLYTCFLIFTSSLLVYLVFSPLIEEETEFQRDEFLSPGHRELDGTTGTQAHVATLHPTHSQPSPSYLAVGHPESPNVEGGLSRVSPTDWPLLINAFPLQLTVDLEPKKTDWASPEDPSRIGQMLDISVKHPGQRGGWYLCLTSCSQPWNSTSNIIVFSACKEVWAYSQQENQISEFYIFQWRVGFRFSFLEHVFSPLGSPLSSPLFPILSSHIKGPPPPSWQTVFALKRTPSECPLLSSLFILFKEILAMIISFFFSCSSSCYKLSPNEDLTVISIAFSQHMKWSVCVLMSDSWRPYSQAPVSMGFFRQEYWSELPCPPPGDLPDPGSNPHLLHLLHCRRILYRWATEIIHEMKQTLNKYLWSE